MRDLKTLYRSSYLYIMLNWTVVIPLRLYMKPSLEDVLQVENEEVPLEDFVFVQTRAGSHSYLCQNKEKKPTAFRPLSSKNPRPALSTFLTERKKVTTQFKFQRYYKKKRYPFWNTCLMFFLYTFLYMYDLAKMCSDKLCKSAFQKSLAKQK